ncbi:hypothetical protein VFC49_09150 [Thermococcus sp. SY098]|uniref:hypothetical protein n=1 Tax=Thermococcus sp. SY098 TaxID=3111325 RepID=UPI002D7A2739|nr:hypothetical protein [Thermococcus sp. SY098]WRS52213.1 hypothetical protein VFC49_09150 [Thermococcus sp. SY098]
MTFGEKKFYAEFEDADNIPVELDASKTKDEVNFGRKAHICAISVSHGNDDYVIVKLRKEEDTRPFWKHKFYKGLNGQVFFLPIPKGGVSKIVIEIEPKPGTTITDSVLVNISYI